MSSYFPPTVGPSGLLYPTYTGIENYLVSTAQTIFGSSIYLGNDSQDFQDIAARSLDIYNTDLCLTYVYNSFSPITAVGTGLDAIVALNGIARHPATYSAATLTITGVAYTVITNGLAVDINGNLWALPASVTIGSGGTVAVSATCQESGPIVALAGQINGIYTPTLGWTSVTNVLAATPGTSIESDSALRARQAVSVENPSQALTTGILGGVLAVSGVTSAVLYENDTNGSLDYINGFYNPSGFPPHSITMVVNGGIGQTIANTIAVRKTPGCYTNGDQIYTYTDSYGTDTTIRFYLPSLQTITVDISITPLQNYNTAIGNTIITDVVNYINSLVIGQNVVISELYAAATAVNNGIQFPYFSIVSLEAAIYPASPATSDISMNFNQQAVTTSASVTLISTTGPYSYVFNDPYNSFYIPTM